MVDPISCIDGYTTTFLADRTKILIRAKHKYDHDKFEFRTVKIFNGQTTMCELPQNYLVDSYHLKLNDYSTKGLILYRNHWGDHYQNHPVGGNMSDYVFFPLIDPDGRELDRVLTQLREDVERPNQEYDTCPRCRPIYSHSSQQFENKDSSVYQIGATIYCCRRCSSIYCENCIKQIKRGFLSSFVSKYSELPTFHFCPNCYYTYDPANSYEGIRSYVVGSILPGAKDADGRAIPY